MGIRGAEKCLHQLSGLTLDELYTAGIQFLNESNGHVDSSVIDMQDEAQNNNKPLQPLILIDANWLAYKLQCFEGASKQIVKFACLFIASGFEVKIIAD